MTKTHKGLLMHIAWAAVTFALANLTVAMFGDGSIDWAHFRFAWTIFWIGLGGAAVNVTIAFYSKTAADEAAELAAPPEPVATPDLNAQIRTAHINGSPASSAPQPPPPADPPTPKA